MDGFSSSPSYSMSADTAILAAPLAIDPLDERAAAVRFEPQCVVIPDPAYRPRLPRVVTKSYALPLWKRRTASVGSFRPSAPPEDAPFDHHQSHRVLRVPLPTISLRPHAAARSLDAAPLPPCLVHRPQPEPCPGPVCPNTPPMIRHARATRKTSHSPCRSDVVTVPLRPCCAACQPVTEAAIVNGDAWPEHFSRAASRRRSLSADDTPRTITVAGSAAATSYGPLGVSISVDEIDKRRRSSDTGPFTTARETLWSNDASFREELTGSPVCRRAFAPHCSADIMSSPSRSIPAPQRIPEEDDDEDESELFPLPSPRRTPSSSPAQSPAGSLSSLMVAAQATNSNGASTCSGDSTGPNNCRHAFLVPPPCLSSSSSLSLPGLDESATNFCFAEDPSSVLSALPSLSNRRSRSPSPRVSLTPPTPVDTLPSSATESTPPRTPRSRGSDPIPALAPAPTITPAPLVIPTSPAGPSLTSRSSPRRMPRHSSFSWRSKRTVSAGDDTPSSSPSSSPTLSTLSSTSPGTKFKSFSIPSPRGVIADVIRGVGAVASSGAIGPGI